jgi:hypothetical protein
VKTPVTITSVIILSGLSAINAQADGLPGWPKAKPGTELLVKDINKLPPDLATLVKETYCLEGYPNNTRCSDITFRFVHFVDSGQYMLLEGTTLYGVSTLFSRSGKIVSLAIGNPREGFGTTANLGQTKIDVADEKLTTSFVFDICGANIWYPEYQYVFGRNGPVLVGEVETNCGTGKKRKTW